MPKPKNQKQLKDYYACVTIETIVYFQASDDDDAENVADEIINWISFDSSEKYESIDYESHEVTEINPHE